MDGGGQLSFDELWKLCSDAAQAAGVELFDLEVPRGNSAALRVFIWRPKTSDSAESASGVTHENCVAVSRTILGWDEERNFLHDSWTLEVSSPGVNRKLTRPSHFDTAVGERVLVKYSVSLEVSGAVDVKAESGEERARGTVRAVGVLRSADAESIVVVDEKHHEEMRIPRNRIREARVDFQF